MTNTLKVNIPVTVRIDVAAWQEEYGCDSTAEIRADIKRHVQSMVDQQLEALGVRAGPLTVHQSDSAARAAASSQRRSAPCARNTQPAHPRLVRRGLTSPDEPEETP